jgi:hypothetical protein
MDGIPQDPVRGIQATMMLADYVDASKGSLTIVGGGANVTGPNAPHALALSFLVPSHLAGEPHTFRLELIDMDGKGVGVSTTGHQPVVIEGQFAVQLDEDSFDGQTFPCPVGVNLGALGLPPHQTYEWRLMVDEQTHEDWRPVASQFPGEFTVA